MGAHLESLDADLSCWLDSSDCAIIAAALWLYAADVDTPDDDAAEAEKLAKLFDACSGGGDE